jgi:stress-induced-phosphoprotein 1
MSSIANAFADPNAIAKVKVVMLLPSHLQLRATPSTAAFMNDPSFVAKLEQIRANPSLLQMFMSDQRILQCLLALMGLDVTICFYYFYLSPGQGYNA